MPGLFFYRDAGGAAQVLMLCGRYFTDIAVSLYPWPQGLVTILQLPRDTLTKATVVEETLDWVLAYSLSGLVHHHHSGKHCGRHGAGQVAESSTLFFRQQEERDWICLGVSEPQSLPPSDTLPLTSVNPLSLSKSSIPSGRSIQMSQRRPLLIRPPHPIIL